MEHIWYRIHAGHVGVCMCKMLCVDDYWRFMLKMSLNDDIIKYMSWNLCSCLRSMIFVEYNMMNIWIYW